MPTTERTSLQQAWPLLSQLYSFGYITEADYERLHELRKQRNAVMHCYRAAAPNAADSMYALDIVNRMLSGQ